MTAMTEAPIPSLAGLDVLLVDDNPHVRELLRDFLSKLGARVSVRPDGASALELGRQQRFDVILLDLRLPDLPGAELAARLRAAGRSASDPWIVGISAGVTDVEIQQTLERGVNDFMLKPVSMAGLAETIRMSPAADKIAPEAPAVAAVAGGASADQRAAFFAELEPIFGRLEQSCLEEQGARLGAEAHYLANGCMVTGFDEGVGVCRDIEQLAGLGAFEAARGKIEVLRQHFSAAIAGADVARGT
jgi:CheY-like chemotaxis protein